jgi:SnoaL-like domain
MGMDVTAVVRRLADKDEIVDLVHRYSYCVDHRMYDELVMLFAEDCVVDYGPGWSPIRGRMALRKMFGHPSVGFQATSHHNANVLVTFDDDDHAMVATSVYAWHRRRDLTTPGVWGYYHDTVTRAQEGWLFATRQLRVLGTEDWPQAMHPAIEAEDR